MINPICKVLAMSTEDSLNEIINVFEQNIPSSITYDAYNSGTLDLTDELDEFDASVKQILGVDEFAPETIGAGKSQISELVALAKQSDAISRKELFIELLEILDEKLDELSSF